MSLTLVAGGTRSGKSATAERLASRSGLAVRYVATARASDPEMQERIARHRARRPESWETVEDCDPLDALAGADGRAVLLDGIGPWLAHRMETEGLFTDSEVAPLGPAGGEVADGILGDLERFAERARSRPEQTIVVAEACGMGLTPLGAGVRRYLDLLGEATRLLADRAERVLFCVAGRSIELPAADPALEAPPAGREPLQESLRVHGDTMAPPGTTDHAVNVAPDGPPEWLRRELESALDAIGRYPDESHTAAALAARHDRAPAEVLVCNGAAEAFWLIAYALRPRRPVVIHPMFTEPEAALRAAGHPVARAFRHPGTFALDPSTVPDEADLVVCGNPNNPTGTLDGLDVVARLARPGRVLVVDEAFMPFSEGEPETLASASEVPGLLVVRSLTKLHATPGVRAGYLLTSTELVSRLASVRQPWSVNTLALAVLHSAAARPSWEREAARLHSTRRNALCRMLAELPDVRVWPSATNFLLLEVPGGPSARHALGEAGISLRRCDTFPGLGPDHLRIAVRRPEDNERLVAVLRSWLAGGSREGIR